nr:MAG TPA: hypothetical protein [Caudoviricetes sp.]
MAETHIDLLIAFRNPVQCEGLHGHPRRHDDARPIFRQYR